MRTDMCIDMCIDMCTEMCMDTAKEKCLAAPAALILCHFHHPAVESPLARD